MYRKDLLKGVGRQRPRAKLISREPSPMPLLHPEVRMAEMVSMGVGSKAFRDIAPSKEAISDRTVNYVLKCRGSGKPGGGVGGRLHGRQRGPLSALACAPFRTLAQVGSVLSQPDLLSYAEVRSRASIAVAPFDCDSPYLGALSSLPGDPASCSVLGSLNLHLYRDPALLGLRWPLCSASFPEEAALEAEVELGSQLSLSRSGFSQKRDGIV